MKRTLVQLITAVTASLLALGGFAVSASAAPRDIHGGPTRMPLELPGDNNGPVRQPEFDPPLPPIDTFDLAVSGSVDLGGCSTTADKVQVKLSGRLLRGTSISPTVTAFSQGDTLRYSTTKLPRIALKAQPSLRNGVCAGGLWNPSLRNIERPGTGNVRNVNFSYRNATKVTRLEGATVAVLARIGVGPVDVVVDNYGPRHGQSRHQANASSVRLAGNTETFTLAEKVIDLDPCGWCPDFGDAKFYVNDMRSGSTDISWDNGLVLDIGFESAGREVKGFYSNGTFGTLSDRAMPDANIDNAHVTAKLVPAADGQGSLRLNLAGTPVLTANIQATGACNIKGVDICDGLTDYKSKIANRVGAKLRTKLQSQAMRDALAPGMRGFLDNQGIGHVLSVSVDGPDLVITSD